LMNDGEKERQRAYQSEFVITTNRLVNLSVAESKLQMRGDSAGGQ
jgi:hypothetical protein